MVAGTAMFAMSVVAIGASLVAYRSAQRTAESAKQRVADLERDLAILLSTSSRAGDRLVEVEQRWKQVSARQDALDGRDTTSPVRQAIALLKRGASVDELVATCGIPRAEAEFMQAMHGAPH